MDPLVLKEKTFGNRRVLAGLSAALLLYALVAMFIPLCVNHHGLVTADPYSYVTFANNLADGNFFLHGEVADAVEALHTNKELAQGPIWNTNVRPDGKMLFTIAIGYPLFLSLMLKLGGMWLVVHINILLQLIVLLLLVWCVWEGLGRDNFAFIAGAITALVFVRTLPATFAQFTYPWREPLFYSCILGGLIGLLRFFRSGRLLPLAMGGLVLGFSATIKEVNALYVFWLGGYFLMSRAFRGHPAKLKVLSVFMIAGLIGVSPLLIQNFLVSGNPIKSMQFLRATSHYSDGGAGMSSKHTGATLISYVTIYRYYPWFSIPCLGVALAGIVMGCRRYPLVRMLAGIFVLHLAVYFQWGNADFRHMYFAHIPYAVFLTLVGVTVVREIIRRVPPLAYYQNWFLFLMLVGAATWPVPWATNEGREEEFLTEYAQTLTDRLDELAGDEPTLFISNRVLRDVLGTYGRTDVVRTAELRYFTEGLDLYDVLDWLIGQGVKIVFFDNVDMDPKHTGNKLLTNRDSEDIRWRFDLIPLEVLDGETYHIKRFLDRPSLTGYEVRPWSNTRIVKEVDVVSPDGLAYLFMRPREVGEAMRVTINDVALEAVSGSYNYLPIQPGLDTRSTVRVELDAGGRKIPAMHDLAVFDWEEPIRMPTGAYADPADLTLFPDGLDNQPDHTFRYFIPSFKLRVPVRSSPDFFTTIGLGMTMIGTAESHVNVTVQTEGGPEELIKVAGGATWFPVLVDHTNRWAGLVDVTLKSDPPLQFKLSRVKSFVSRRRLAHTSSADACAVGLLGYLTPMARGEGLHDWEVAVNGSVLASGGCMDDPRRERNAFTHILSGERIEPEYRVEFEGVGLMKPVWVELDGRLDAPADSEAAMFLAEGWHPREQKGKEAFVWAKGRSVVRVPVQPGVTHYRLEIECVDGHPSRTRSCTARVGEGAGQEMALPGTRQVIEAEFRDVTAKHNGLMDLVLEVEPWIPSEILADNNDSRELGFQVFRVLWEPVVP